MRTLAPTVKEWLAQGRPVTLARVTAMDGFGGRRLGEAMATSNGDTVGGLLSGAGADELREAAEEVASRGRASVHPIPIADAEAVTAGMACGGVARVLVQPAQLIPASFWTAIESRTPVALATLTDGKGAGASVVVNPDGSADGSVGDAASDAAVVSAATEMLSRGRVPQQTVDTAAGTVFIETVNPQPHAVVVGQAELATSIERQGALLGWSTTIVDERSKAGAEAAVTAAGALGPVDALIVLSHDVPISATAMHAALTGRCGYVGALGSRHTQGLRAAYLTDELDAPEELVARIHGPIGLDIGARTPEETALCIFAEIVAHRSGRNPGSLRASNGPING